MVVGDADGAAVRDLGVLKSCAFDLGGADVLAPAYDQVLDAARKAQVAVFSEVSHVPGVEPTVLVYGFGGLFGHIVVALHDDVAADADLADLAGRKVLAGAYVGDLALQEVHHVAEGLGAQLERVGEVRGGKAGRGLCLPEA